MATNSQLLDRLNVVVGRPDRNIAAMVVDLMRKEKGKDKKIQKPDKCVMTACSTPQEEMDRWPFITDPEQAARFIEAVRRTVEIYIDKLDMGLEPMWQNVRGKPLTPSKPPIDPEERERNRWRMVVLKEWQANGKLTQKDERGNHRYSLADCKAEAVNRRRIADQMKGQR